ncbi:MAG: metalloregulator ArsR/SmtB family transcription factor [Candidatus Humimicrobiaceae bacterium]
MEKSIISLTKIFKALSDEKRLKILLFIYNKGCKCEDEKLSCQNETCIKDLTKLLNITPPTISHHIKELVNAGLIITKKEGKWVYCRINIKVFEKVHGFISKFSNNKGLKH